MSSSNHLPRIILTTVVITALALGAVAAGPNGPGSDGAANKVAASGSAMLVWGPGDNDGITSGGEAVKESETVPLLEASVKLSTPEDLILSVALECSISTELVTVGNSSANASGTVEVWITIDGKKVPVSLDDTDENTMGEVTYCNRAYGRTTTMFDDEDASIQSHIRTKQSHSFNWLALDEVWADAADDNIHEIVVWAKLEQTAEGSSADDGNGDATAMVTVGKRTLIIEPTKVANGETVEIS